MRRVRRFEDRRPAWAAFPGRSDPFVSIGNGIVEPFPCSLLPSVEWSMRPFYGVAIRVAARCRIHMVIDAATSAAPKSNKRYAIHDGW